MNTEHGRPSLFLKDGSSPAWSPDGSRLAFVRTVAGNTDVYTVAVDGDDLVHVTTDPGVDTEPAWGPGGTRLTFASERDGDFDIYTADPDGSNVRPLSDDGLDQRNPSDFWTWRNIGYDQGPESDSTWCWQDIGPPATLPGVASGCADSGKHSYAAGTFTPFAWLEPAPNGATHLWVRPDLGGPTQVSSGRKSDADPAVRPASRAVVARLTEAARDIDLGLLGAKTWADENGTLSGADEGPNGLILVAPSLCLIGAADRSMATSTICDSGTGPGSTSVYADQDQVALARDTDLGFCLFASYRLGYPFATFGSALRAPDCTGEDARSAGDAGW